MAEIEESVERLKAQIRSYRDRRTRLSEADTLRVLITPMLLALGWAIYDVDEVRNEYRHKTSDNPVDYALFLNRTPVLFVEAKALGEGLDERRWMVQTINYANTSGVEWCILTNGDEYRFYKVHAQVQVEDKLFLSVVIGDDTPTDVKVRKLSLISRERMGMREIDELWTQWRVDHQVRTILESLPDDDAFLRFAARKSDGRLRPSEIRDSLRRATLRVDYPGIGDVTKPPPAVPSGMSEPPALSLATEPASSATAALDEDQGGESAAEKKERARPMRTAEMLERGLIAPGLLLRIRGHPESAATIVDGKRVDFRGERITYNEWGCRVTGWKAIQIYIWAELPDGRLLDDLRQI